MKINKKIIFISLVVLVMCASVPVFVAAAGYNYTLMERIPGFDGSSDLPTYIGNIYKFGIWTVGIASLLMLSIGGFMYFTAAGNTSSLDQAKKVITDAILGLIMALTAWLLLNILNPDLLKGNISALSISGTAVPATTTGTTTTGTTRVNGPNTCNIYPNTNNVINFNTSNKTTLPIGCDRLDSDFQSVASSTGIDKKILKAIAAQESTCGKNLIGFDGKSCGIMHLRMDTAGKDCNWLVNNAKESIRMAAEFIKSNSSKHGGDLEKILVGYNGGYNAIGNDGKKGPLAESVDCPGVLAYQCCINPGGLAGAQDYVFKTKGYYNGQ